MNAVETTWSLPEQEELLNRQTVPAKKKGYSLIKSCFDFTASACAGMVLLVPVALIALAIVVKDPGNPFFLHERVGKDGKPIAVLKFRSMKTGAEQLEKTLTPEQLEEYKQEYKLKDDPRLIGYKKPGDGNRCFGALLRRTSVDELPQIYYNIFWKRNMSVVGPRPILETELEENYTPQEQRILLSVKPGLTGYWQAYARNNATYTTGQRQKMELHYVRNRSLWFDIKIMLRTVVSVVTKVGAE